MEVSCPACGARYTADDEKLRGKTARMRCKACNELWLVTGPNIASMASFRPPAEQASDGDTGRRRAAVVRNGSEREKRDLFAAREPDVGSVKQTLLPPRTFHSSGVGARNENSVLFRVDQLASTAQVKKSPAPEPSRANDAVLGDTDDDGIIDLNALSSTAPRKLGSPVAPLFFSETPPVSLDVNGSAGSAPTSKRTGKLRVVGGVALAVTVALASVFGIALAFKGEEPVAHVATSSASTPSSPAPTESTPDVPVPPPAVVAAAAASDSDSAESDVREKKPKRGSAKGRKGKGGRTKAAKGPPKAAAPAAKPAKAADPCGCKGDFNCNLACAAKNGR